ncbi:MAG: dTDP-4-dehydrorhamnose 3,5-epimerase family protein [Anaerolineaceae bacterium]|nr:dTDP-4-dehydrorhamnose 3,5-epimerase family protein [Anaerolineaceae bacterium]
MLVEIQPLASIEGVQCVDLRAAQDERGSFRETFRRSWFPQVDWSELQQNHSNSRAEVLRGLHFHRHQGDYWYPAGGCLRVGLVDLRRASPTFRASAMLELDAAAPRGLWIPPGVAHGFYAITPCVLLYIVNRDYRGADDEFGLAWDDEQLALDWGVVAPTLSERDQNNPTFSALLAAGELP